MKSSSEKQTAFQKWLASTNQTHLAKALGVNRSTIGHWKRGHVRPSLALARRIVSLTEGHITFEMMAKGPSTKGTKK